MYMCEDEFTLAAQKLFVLCIDGATNNGDQIWFIELYNVHCSVVGFTETLIRSRVTVQSQCFLV